MKYKKWVYRIKQACLACNGEGSLNKWMYILTLYCQLYKIFGAYLNAFVSIIKEMF